MLSKKQMKQAAQQRANTRQPPRRRARGNASQRGNTQGDRPVARPAAYGISRRTGIPRTSTVGNLMSGGYTTVRHREYITDVSGAAIYAAAEFAVNPGNDTTFPWLAAMAAGFEHYQFEHLAFELKTTSPTTVSGSHGIIPMTDAREDKPSTKVDALAFAGASRAPVWGPCRAVYSRETLSKKLYVRVGSPIPDTDIKTYDLGKLVLYVEGLPTSAITVTGELYVDYVVRLYSPRRLTNNSAVSGYREVLAPVAPSVPFLSSPSGSVTDRGHFPGSVHPSSITFTTPGDYVVTVGANKSGGGPPGVISDPLINFSSGMSVTSLLSGPAVSTINNLLTNTYLISIFESVSNYINFPDQRMDFDFSLYAPSGIEAAFAIIGASSAVAAGIGSKASKVDGAIVWTPNTSEEEPPTYRKIKGGPDPPEGWEKVK